MILSGHSGSGFGHFLQRASTQHAPPALVLSPLDRSSMYISCDMHATTAPLLPAHAERQCEPSIISAGHSFLLLVCTRPLAGALPHSTSHSQPLLWSTPLLLTSPSIPYGISAAHYSEDIVHAAATSRRAGMSCGFNCSAVPFCTADVLASYCLHRRCTSALVSTWSLRRALRCV